MTTTRTAIVSTIALITLLASSCGTGSGAASTTPGSSPPDSTAVSVTTSSKGPGSVTTVTLPAPGEGTPVKGSGPIDPALQPFIDVAAADLSDRLGIARTDITVQSAVLTVWSDTSLGCPNPKMQYAQILTDGAAIELVAAGSTYWYHSGGTRGPFLCESAFRQQP